MHKVMLDTGALVALLDRSERNHSRCREFFKQFQGELFSTEPVLTETLYLLGPKFHHQRLGLDFFLQGGATLVPQSQTSLSRSLVLMEKYADTPMDFADATLVVLGEEMNIDEVFTLDYRGFNTFRLNQKDSFKILPD